MRLLFAALTTTGHDTHGVVNVVDLALVEMHHGQLTGANWYERFSPWHSPLSAKEPRPRLSTHCLETRPQFHQALPQLLQFARLDQVVVHDVPRFHPALAAEFDRIKAYAPHFYWSEKLLDTRPLLRALHPGLANSLPALCALYGVAAGKDNASALQRAHVLARLWQAAHLADHAPTLPLHLER